MGIVHWAVEQPLRDYVAAIEDIGRLTLSVDGAGWVYVEDGFDTSIELWNDEDQEEFRESTCGILLAPKALFELLRWVQARCDWLTSRGLRVDMTSEEMEAVVRRIVENKD